MSAPRHLSLRESAAALMLALHGCGAPPPVAAAPPSGAHAFELEVVAEGPCGRLSVQGFEGRTLLVYGETGYDLHDWNVGEKLAAAQSFVELRGGGAFRVRSLYDGLPVNAGGYVAADLSMGESIEEGPWLFAVETEYAARGEGRLFERHGRAYARKGKAWVATANESPFPLPGVARSLPPLPLETACAHPDLRFIPLASARLPSSEVLVAGRCQDASHVNTRETSVLVAHGRPGASSWSIESAPDATSLDGIVNLGLHARSASEAFLVAWEPFKPPSDRRAYLARWNGTRWAEEETSLPEGLMSVASADDGTLYVAAGRALYKQRQRGTPFELVPLPPLRFATEPHPSTLRVHTVRAVAGDLWVEGTYRVSLPTPNKPVEARASVLYRVAKGPAKATAPLFCDAREPAERALVSVDPVEARP
jgi:hypothetical protein